MDAMWTITESRPDCDFALKSAELINAFFTFIYAVIWKILLIESNSGRLTAY